MGGVSGFPGKGAPESQKPQVLCLCVCLPALTGKPCVMGTSILKRRIRALNRVQTRIGSLGSQTTQPTLERGKLSVKAATHVAFTDCICLLTCLEQFKLSTWRRNRVQMFGYFILMMSMPVTVRLMWSPAAAQSRGSS